MNFSVLTTIVIVAITALLAAFQNTRLTTLEETQTTLVKRATALGIPIDDIRAGKTGKGSAPSGRKATDGGQESDHRAIAKKFATELFAFAKKMKAWEDNEEEPPVEAQREAMAFFQRFLDLDPGVMTHLLDEIRATNEFDEETKGEIMMMSLMALSQTSPETALHLYINSKDLIDEEMADQVVAFSLATWSQNSPDAALKWLEDHRADLPEEVSSRAYQSAVLATFKSDPHRAIELALQLTTDQLGSMSGQLSRMSSDPQNQLEILRALNQHTSPLSEINHETPTKEDLLRQQMLTSFGYTLVTQSFDEASETLLAANLSPFESQLVTQSIAGHYQEVNDPDKWLPWLYENSPEESRSATIDSFVSKWTRQDFRATAAWIGEQPQGPLRRQATHSFAQTVAPHEPASAAEWALTLPASEERTDLLHQIHRSWAGKDEAAAAAFAAEHGLVTETE